MAEAKKITGGDPVGNEDTDTATGKKANGPAVGNQQTPEQNVGNTTKAVSTTKKALGSKEVAPFEWKVIGTSGDTVLILFKSVERADAEAQLTRLSSDGYYKDLRIVEIDAKIVQPRPAKTRRSAAKSSEKTTKAKKVAGSKVSKAKPAVKKKAPAENKSASKEARTKGARKSPVKGAKKKTKTASAKSGKRKTARKK